MLVEAKRGVLMLLVVAGLMVSLLATPASAQQQQGLVNVNVSGNTIRVPISVAANLCDLNAAVLAQQFRQHGQASCTAVA